MTVGSPSFITKFHLEDPISLGQIYQTPKTVLENQNFFNFGRNLFFSKKELGFSFFYCEGRKFFFFFFFFFPSLVLIGELKELIKMGNTRRRVGVWKSGRIRKVWEGVER